MCMCGCEQLLRSVSIGFEEFPSLVPSPYNRESSKVRGVVVNPVDHVQVGLGERLSEGVGGHGRMRIFTVWKWERERERERIRSDKRNVGEWSGDRKRVFEHCLSFIRHAPKFVSVFWNMKFAHNKLPQLRIELSYDVLIKTIMTAILTQYSTARE